MCCVVFWMIYCMLCVGNWTEKILLVVPRRLKSRETTITENGKSIKVNGKRISVNRKEKTVIDQRKRLSDYLSVLYKSRRKTT